MILEIIYDSILLPIETVMYWLFRLFNSLTGSHGLSIIILSIVINISLIPVYLVTDAMQADELGIKKKIEPKLNEIKAVFKGQERFMMTRMLFRINGITLQWRYEAVLDL